MCFVMVSGDITQQTKDVESTLVHRLRRLTNVKPTLIQRLVSAGNVLQPHAISGITHQCPLFLVSLSTLL